MLKVLRQPRWIALIIAVPVGVVLCLMLSDWQWNRWEGRKDANVIQQRNIAAPAVPVQQLMANSTGVDDALHWRSVTAVGEYLVAEQVLVRKRPLNGTNGFWVLTPMKLATGQVVVINRGWIPAGETALSTPTPPAPPTGVVTVNGRLQATTFEPSKTSDMPAGQVAAPNVSEIAGPSNAPVIPAYLDLVSSAPQQAAGLVPIPLPDLSEGPHLSYSLQWVAFAILFIVGLVLLLRREFRLRKGELDLRDGSTSTPSGESDRSPQDSTAT